MTKQFVIFIKNNAAEKPKQVNKGEKIPKNLRIES